MVIVEIIQASTTLGWIRLSKTTEYCKVETLPLSPRHATVFLWRISLSNTRWRHQCVCEQMFCLFPGFHPRWLAPSAQPARAESMETCQYDQYDQYEHNEGISKDISQINNQWTRPHLTPHTNTIFCSEMLSPAARCRDRGQGLKIAAQIAVESWIKLVGRFSYSQNFDWSAELNILTTSGPGAEAPQCVVWTN